MSDPRAAGAGGTTRSVTADDLRRFTRAIFERAGMSAAHAAQVADVLVWADLRGVETHGVTRVPRYLGMIAAGDLNPAPAIGVRTETAASVLLDADRAAGPVAMTAGMEWAVRKAREAGVGLALVRGTTHTAALGYYTLLGARQGMAAIAMSGSIPNMAYHGARAAGVSTSPLSIAVPRGDASPLVFDMGTGVISVGKLRQASKTGSAIPVGSALDANGNPTTDPRAAQIPLPLGGPKGSGLALMIECVTSLLVGNAIIAETLAATPAGRHHKNNGLALAIDIARFAEPAAFASEVDRLVRALKALPRDPEIDEILAPGERGDRMAEERSRTGVPIPRATLDELARVAERLGVPMV